MDKKQIREIKNRLAELVDQCGKQNLFAERLGFSESSVSNWLNHKLKDLPSVETFITIADEFGKSVDWLLARDDSSAGTGSLKMNTMSDVFRIIIALVNREYEMGIIDVLGYPLEHLNHLPKDRMHYNHMFYN